MAVMKRLIGMDLIRVYDEHPEKFLPMNKPDNEVPPRNEYDETNIGWYAGLLDEKRPFFAECWAVDGRTVLTMFVSTLGIEDETPEELEQRFLDRGYYRKREGADRAPAVRTFAADGNEFYSINVTVGVDDEPAVIEGAYILSWNVYNKYISSLRKDE